MKRTAATRALILLTLWALLLALPQRARAQEDYRYDIGGGFGMTGYLGDANSANLWGNHSWDLQVCFRYLPNNRWAFKTNMYAGGLRGNSAQMENVLPEARNFKFTTTFYEFGELAEFNFFPYGMGKQYQKLKRWTPYIAAGFGFTVWSTDQKAHFSPVIPIGGGVKFKVNPRLNLGVEFLMKKTFSDKLDGNDLSDPYLIKSSFAKNTDWYSTLTFTVTYEFSKRCRACNYKER